MQPGSSPDLSRGRLRDLAAWIRDDLDPVIAREGPAIMLPDDVLMLNEIFVALHASQTVTANTLRYTGIHRAIMLIRGKATRWPGRLVDQCDMIVDTWTENFGPLDNLRPFLFGRGGRLEGIARPGDRTRKDLLKRWEKLCPERLVPYNSRRHGHLGFKPGDWWISPLFAHHAGIIDIETIDRGICHDQHGAYALLLQDSEEEIMTATPTEFTYRCYKPHPGRFRLTAADARSRYPIRVLRSHNLTNLWAPKVGVRYEGLFRVTGWSIRAKPLKFNELKKERGEKDAKGKVKLGELSFEIHFERDDPSDMEEVMRHPLGAESDDYLEYRRLRRIHRDDQHELVPEAMAPEIAPHLAGELSLSPFAPGRPRLAKTISGNLVPIESGLLVPGAMGSSVHSSALMIQYPNSMKSNLQPPTDEGPRTPSYQSMSDSQGYEELDWRTPSVRSHDPRDGWTLVRDVAPWVSMEPFVRTDTEAAGVYGKVAESKSAVESNRFKKSPTGLQTIGSQQTAKFDASSGMGPSLSRLRRLTRKTFRQNTQVMSLDSDTGETRKSRRTFKTVARSISPFVQNVSSAVEAKDAVNVNKAHRSFKAVARGISPFAKHMGANQDGTTSDKEAMVGASYLRPDTPVTSALPKLGQKCTNVSTSEIQGPLIAPIALRPLLSISSPLLQRRDAFSGSFLHGISPIVKAASPVVTWPTTDDEWSRILNMGKDSKDNASSGNPFLHLPGPYEKLSLGKASRTTSVIDKGDVPSLGMSAIQDDVAEWVYGAGNIVFRNPFRNRGAEKECQEERKKLTAENPAANQR